VPDGDIESEYGSYRPKRTYARTKREQLVISEMWARRLEGSGVVVHAMHPGWVDTPGVRRSMPLFRRLTRPVLRTPAEGADTIAWLAGSPRARLSTGLFWHDRRPRPTHYAIGARPEPEPVRRRLWTWCETAFGGCEAPSGHAPGGRAVC
jgi:dehydrogenase/reductase SDR family member 12